MVGRGRGAEPAPARRRVGRTGLAHAEDILQDQLGINRMAAFGLISDVAERHDRTVRDVAEEIIRLRRLPV